MNACITLSTAVLAASLGLLLCEMVRRDTGSMPLKAGLCAVALAAGLSSCYFGSLWRESYWLGDMRSGDKFSIAMDMRESTRMLLPKQDPIRFSEADVGPHDATCVPNHVPGKSFDPLLLSGRTFSLELLGRSTLSGRYLVRASSPEIGRGCTGRFLVSSQDLADIKSGWKVERRIMAREKPVPAGLAPALGEETGSVQRLDGHGSH